MNTSLSIISKDVILYSTIILAGLVYSVKKLFGKKKTDKNLYDKSKRKLNMKSKLFFSEITKKVNLKLIHKNNTAKKRFSNSKLEKMAGYIEKISKEILAIDEGIKEKEKENDSNKFKPNAKSSSSNKIIDKKEQIFFYLLNNVSTMIAKSNNENNKIKPQDYKKEEIYDR